MVALLCADMAKKMELLILQFQSRATVPAQEGQATGISHWLQSHMAEVKFQVSVADRAVTPFLSPAPLIWVAACPAENNEALILLTLTDL